MKHVTSLTFVLCFAVLLFSTIKQESGNALQDVLYCWA